MADDRPANGNRPPSHDDDDRPVSWVSLFRTARAPLAVLVLAGAALIIAPQRGDMLATLANGGFHFWPAVWFHVSLAVLSVSAWYWARALIDARFDVVGTRADRLRLMADDKRINPFALAAVPWLIVILSVALGVILIPPGQYLPNLAMLLVWVAAFVAIAAFSWLHPAATKETRSGERSRRGFCALLRRAYARWKLLANRAPGWPWLAWVIIAFALLLFVVGAVASFVDWEGVSWISLPTRIATTFPGPSAALICLGLMIGPLSVITFLADGFRFSWKFGGQRMGLSRPPVILFLMVWIGFMPYFFSLHTVRVVPSTLVTPRASLDDFFATWAKVCAPAAGPVRPIIVAVSGGASRAAVWAASVLERVEDASPTGPGPTVFAVSSVSGGSLGVAAYMALLHDLPPDQLCAHGSTAARKKQVALLGTMPLAHDALGPLLAAAIAVDIPRALLSPFAAVARLVSGHQPQGGDRAEWIERAFEGIWKAATPKADGTLFNQPFLSLFYDGLTGGPKNIRPGMPIWIANGTEIGTGSRIFTVPFLPKEPKKPKDWPFHATKDALSVLKGDVSISTAVNNTARFPYLEPSGELMAYRDPNQRTPRSEQFRMLRGNAREIVDGGYFENEGLQTALDLAAWLSTKGPALVGGRLVEPIIVQATADGDAKVQDVDVVRCGLGGADDPTAAPLPTKGALQLLAPVFGLYNVRGGHSAALLRMAKLGYCNNAFFHFYLPGLPQDGSPDKVDVPLNWVLSDGTTTLLRKMMTEDAGNAGESHKLIETLKRPWPPAP